MIDNKPRNKVDPEVRIELLRPQEIVDRKKACSLVFLPVGPLEYHGPHLPAGTDAINATRCALGVCRRLGAGVVMPTLYWGTERERPDWMLKSLGFEAGDWIVGMDFPTALWNSHYCSEQIFALVLGQQIEFLIRDGYKLICIINGHGAVNQLAAMDRLARHYSHESPSRVMWAAAFSQAMVRQARIGHADAYETSLMMHYEEASGELVDLSTLPPRRTPIRYKDFSIVDAPGFSRRPRRDRIVRDDPRDASAVQGKRHFEDTVREICQMVRKALRQTGIHARRKGK